VSEFDVQTGDYQRLARRLRTIDGDVKKQMNQSLRKVAAPVGKFVAVSAGHELPRRGGLGYAIGGARPGVTATVSSVSIRFNVRDRWYLARIDAGTVRHPVFGRKPMVEQQVRPGSFRRPFDEAAPLVRAEVLGGLEQLLNTLDK
jgi:hypothetical protein